MTNAELIAKIKAEIERLRLEAKENCPEQTINRNYTPTQWQAIGEYNAYEIVGLFLSTLESEAKEEKKVPTRIYLGSRYEFIRKDILLNEIERLKNNNEVQDNKEYAQYELDVACGYDMACDDILSFLKPFAEVDKHPKNILAPSKECEPGLREPLESEKPMNQEGLEDEIKRYLREECSDDDEPGIHEIAEHFAQCGAEWQKEQDEILKVNYEGARTVYDNTVQHLQEKIDEKYELGKKDMKEQMLKGAVEGVLVDNVDGTQEICLHGNRYGEKVRIIIVKEDEK